MRYGNGLSISFASYKTLSSVQISGQAGINNLAGFEAALDVLQGGRAPEPTVIGQNFVAYGRLGLVVPRSELRLEPAQVCSRSTIRNTSCRGLAARRVRQFEQIASYSFLSLSLTR